MFAKSISFRKLLITCVFISAICNSLIYAAAVFHVSPQGNDIRGNGTASQPWKSISTAVNHISAKGINKDMKQNITVYLHGGRYQIEETVKFVPEHSGTNGHYIIFKPFEKQQPIISGGRQIKGWEKVAGKPYWEASVGESKGFSDYFRQLYVNGVRAERASSGWIKGEERWYDDPATPQKKDGMYFEASTLKDYTNIKDMRLISAFSWKVDEFAIVAIHDEGEFKAIQFAQPHFDWRAKGMFRNVCDFMIVSAKEELDEHGEWYLDRKKDKVYYYPYSFEDMNEAEVYAPVVETLMLIEGSGDHKVENIRIEGITFEHGNWLLPGNRQIGGTQAEVICADNSSQYAKEVPGNITLKYTDGIQFVNNTLKRLGACGIHLSYDVDNTLIEGNLFNDLTAAGVLVGRWGGVKREPGLKEEAACDDNIINNNVFRNIGVFDFWQATAISLISSKNCRITHNDITDIAYMGIHQRHDGKHHEGTFIYRNRVSYATNGSRYGVHDAGGIYTHGEWPDTLIEENYVFKTPFVSYYVDDDSYNTTLISNVGLNAKRNSFVVPGRVKDISTIVLENNYGDWFNEFAPGVVVKNHHYINEAYWPKEVSRIIANAGVEDKYKELAHSLYTENIARARHLTSSGVFYNHVQRQANDGSYETYCELKQRNNGNNLWIKVDLGAEYIIQKVALSPPLLEDDPQVRNNIEIQASNDEKFETYTVLWEQNDIPYKYKGLNYPKEPPHKLWRRNSNTAIKYVNNPKPYRYIRAIKKKGHLFCVSELEVFGITEH